MSSGASYNGKQVTFDQPVLRTVANHNKGAYWVNREVTVVFQFWKQY